ncbi:hypothetical protein Rsub_00920 [Raphidocelis subcapitata]|uniref:Uncharacterized protein n=1 Tax=Raphidocelis subcapitata TaxID=307507 RepID=A0A2V0NLC9_9CHLO|nr:hypothetical protein Rsub_00920 [Raphidocelis subcapitata]|eukprot:GBF88208.1 hypothetical protein Rsub_00920 [Raphidocelis subcapitata]
MDGIKALNDKEKAQEAIWAKQNDEQLLRGMLDREKTKKGADEAALRAILEKYTVSDADIAAVMAWKQRPQ